MTGYVYILISEKSGRFYIGSTVDPKRRLTQHNNGEVRATRGKGPWRIAKLVEFLTSTDARRAENYLKKQKSHKAIEVLIVGKFQWPQQYSTTIRL